MASIVVGTLRTMLTMDTAQYEAGVRRGVAATNTMQRSTKDLSTRMVGAAAAMGAFVGTLGTAAILQAGTALLGMAKGAFSAASNIIDLANKTGLSTTAIQRMQFVADQTGTTLDAMTAAAFRLGVRLDGGGKSVVSATKELGLSWQSLKTMRPDQQFETVVAALGRMQDAQERNRLGMELFGKSFSTIAASVAEGYDTIADAATISSRAQLEALDRAADRWQKFVTTTKTNVTAFMGQMLLMNDAMRQVEAEGGRNRREQILEAQRRVALGLTSTRKADIALSSAAAEADASYAAQLVKVRAELAALTSAQRAEIAAAQQLGVNLDELEAKYGLTEGALKLLTASSKEGAKASKEQAEAAAQLAKEYEGVLSWARNLQGEVLFQHDADLMRLNDYRAGLEGLLSTMQRMETVQPPPWLPSRQIDITGPLKWEMPRAGDIWSKRAEDAMPKISTHWKEMVEGLKRTWGTLETAIQGSFAQILLRTRSFKEAMIDIWNSIKGALVNIFADIAGAYLKQLARMALGRMGANVTGGVLGSVLGGGTAAATGSAAAAGAGGGLSGGFLTNPAFWTNPWTIAAIGGAVLGGFIWKKGLFRGGEEALKVNPRRDQFLAQFGGSGTGAGSGFRVLADRLFALDHHEGLFTALRTADRVSEFERAQSAIVGRLGRAGQRVQSFALGGFVPPGMVVPAMLHGGAHGEMIVPLDKAGAGSRVVNQYITVQGIIDRDNAVSFWREHILPQAKRALELNTDDYLTVHQRVRA